MALPRPPGDLGNRPGIVVALIVSAVAPWYATVARGFSWVLTVEDGPGPVFGLVGLLEECPDHSRPADPAHHC